MHSSESGTIHIVGAGLAGLAAAVRLTASRRPIVIHEATTKAGGRCRSYFDQATNMLIDNGTHLLLSGNHAALAYAKTIGGEPQLQVPAQAEFPFVDLASGERWHLRFGDGRIPWWVFDKDRRVPQTAAADYLPLARLLWATTDRTVGDVINCTGPIYDRFVEPLLLAALNIAPREGSSRLAAAVVRETLAKGGNASRPLLARDGIGNVFVEPAIRYLAGRCSISFEDELRALRLPDGRVSGLEFATRTITLGDNDAVILAIPPYAAAALVPGLQTPTAFRGILNAHFRIASSGNLPPMLGVINGTSQWIFSHPGRISVTISDGGALFDLPREELAQKIWREVAALAGLPEALPPWQIVRERRATFAATPGQNVLRPGPATQWSNLFLAGDWTATGLPATIESAVRSGNRAADLAVHALRVAA